MTAQTKIRNPRSSNGERRVQIPVSFKPPEAEELKKIAAETGTTVSMLIQDAISKKFNFPKAEKTEAKQ